MILVEAKNLSKRFGNGFKAVDDVSFSIPTGTTLGLIGESGSGKTTVAKMVAGMFEMSEGTLFFEGKQLSGNRSKDIKKAIQYVFQDPYTSLNPNLRVFQILAEPLNVYFKLNREQLKARVLELLHDVGLDESYSQRFPGELSGGQRQRIGIARAIAPQPKIIICDEPTSALDVTIQSQILNLLKTLQQKHNLSYLFIAHSLEVIYNMSDAVLVMKDGVIVESGSAYDIFHHPQHAYTQSLMDAILSVDIPYYPLKED